MDISEHFLKIMTTSFALRRKGFLCDTVLMAGTKHVKAHSVILASASPFFQSVFKQYQQPEMYYIRLPGIEPEMLQIVVDYIYSGKLILPYQNEKEVKLPPTLFDSFQLFGIDLTSKGEFVVDYRREDEMEDEPENTELIVDSLAIDELMGDVDKNELFQTDHQANGIDGAKEKVTEVKLVSEEAAAREDSNSTSPVNEAGKKLWLCQTCQKTFTKKSTYDHHMQKHVEETKPNLCELCGLAITGKAEMQQHLAVAHAKNPRSSEWHLCNECGKTFSKESTLISHVVKVHKRGAGASSMINSRIENEREVFVCEFCNKQYASRTSIKLHTVMAHSDSKPFQCHECGKGFAFKSQMISHTRMHTGERPFECQTCGKTFSAMLNLVQHNRIHTGERPFECSYCGNRFSQRSHLQTHVRTHTGEKPYVCHLCSKSYKNRLDLRIHCLRIHQINIKLREPNQLNNPSKMLKHR
ncbi:hypothetical protein HELRODRAFT_103045 [Helobdella robusta]|uniref:BTB domain-containing protein n=1 Tax=Helobdella robusta TaxID=6412 RepID=T1EDD9_HELRO|nr:hypothetical protein HELRODRAFT_103045 [Helobdella robusta]ESN94118.1 hypothetical protein HELRODRAFT_103045 [Helobdella robusta]